MNNIPFSLSIYDNAIWMRLIDVCERHKGIDITVYEMENMHSENGDIRIFAAGNTYVDTTSKYLEKDALKKVIHEPSIIVKSRGIIGFEYYDKPFTHKNEMWSYTTNDKRINLKFLYYYLSNNVSFFQQQAVIGKLPQISVKDTDEFSIPIIPLIYQNQIAECLYFIDKQIEQQRKELDALKQHKQALMQQLFPQRGQTTPILRLKEYRKKGNWKLILGEKLFDCITTKAREEQLPILAISQEFGAIPREDINYNVFVNPENISNYKVVKKGDFIISLRSFQGGIEYSEYDGLCSPAYVILRKIADIDNVYFKYYFKTKPFVHELNKNLEGIRDGKIIKYSQFAELKIPVPQTKNEQISIASIFTSLDKLINSQSQKLQYLIKHKKGLMQQLFPKQ